MRMITMVIMMNVVNENGNGYVITLTNLEGSDKVVVGTKNMFIRNSNHGDDKVSFKTFCNEDLI